MGANTSYYVKVKRGHSEWITVSALTKQDAIEEAMREPGVMSVEKALHWSEFEEGEEDGKID